MDLNINVVQTVTIADDGLNYSSCKYVVDVWFVDYVNGATGNTGRSWASAKKIISEVGSLSTAPYKEVHVAKSPDPVSLGNATWVDNSNTLTLASAATLLCDNCADYTTWVASLNITLANNTTYYKEGSQAMSITPATAFTTGKMCYKALAASTDYSAYTKITFWIRPSGGVAANTLKFILSSDTTGDTEVDGFTIPYALQAATWHPITLSKNGGGYLGSAIQSIAFVALLDPGTTVLVVDNINAANDLHLRSLLGKKTTAEPCWMALKSINGTTVIFGNVYHNATTTTRWGGVAETTTVYALETIPILQHLPTVQSGSVFSLSNQGQPITPIVKILGGWNPSTNVRDGFTFYDAIYGWGIGFNYSRGYYELAYFGLVRFYDSIQYSIGGDWHWWHDIHIVSSGNYGINNSQAFYQAILTDICITQSISYNWSANFFYSVVKNFHSIGGSYLSIQSNCKNTIFKNFSVLTGGGIQISNIGMLYMENVTIENCSSGFSISASNVEVHDFSIKGCGYGIDLSGNVQPLLKMSKGTISGSTTADIRPGGSATAEVYLVDVDLQSTTKVFTVVYHTQANVISVNDGGVAGAYRQWSYYYTLKTNTADFRTASPCIEVAGTGYAFLNQDYFYGGAGSPGLDLHGREQYLAEYSFIAPAESGVERTLTLWAKATSDFDGKFFLGVRYKGKKSDWLVAPVQYGLQTYYRDYTIVVPSGSITKDGVLEYVIRFSFYTATTATKFFLDDFSWL